MFLALLLSLVLVSQPHAQVNVEHYRDRAGVTGGANYSFNTDLGNVDVVNSGGAGNIVYRTASSSTLCLFYGNVSFHKGARLANKGVVHLRHTRREHPVYQPEAFVQADYAKSRRLDGRYLLGGGIRFRIREGEHSSLSLGNSLMWERETLDVREDDPHPSFTSVLRSSNYINLRWQGRATLSTTAYYQFIPTDPSDVRILGTAELTAPLLGALHQTTSLTFRVDTDPPMGVKKADVKVATSFGVRL